MSSDPRWSDRRASHPADSEPPRWLDSPRNVDGLVYGVCAIAALLLLIDPLIHKHGPFEIEHYWGFYGIYALAGCILLVLAATALRRVVTRPEDYYDR